MEYKQNEIALLNHKTEEYSSVVGNLNEQINHVGGEI